MYSGGGELRFAFVNVRVLGCRRFANIERDCVITRVSRYHRLWRSLLFECDNGGEANIASVYCIFLSISVSSFIPSDAVFLIMVRLGRLMFDGLGSM